MKVKFLLDEDFVNYKKPSMFIGFPRCNWKCEKECGKPGICQNSPLANSPDIEIDYKDIVKRYIDNPITKAIVMGGLEPLDTFEDVALLISEFRQYTDDDIVIYTGYNEFESRHDADYFRQNYNNIIIKYGRYKPDSKSIYDEVLGVTLASDNQYAERIC
jgi:hypothetical protein